MSAAGDWLRFLRDSLPAPSGDGFKTKTKQVNGYWLEVRIGPEHSYGWVSKAPMEKLDRRAPAVIFARDNVGQWRAARIDSGPINLQGDLDGDGWHVAPWAERALEGLYKEAKG